MGLFDFLKKKKPPKPNATSPKFKNSVEKEMYEKNLYGYRDKKDHLDYQNALLTRVNAAQAKYKQDGNLDEVIKELEFAFIESKPPCATSQNMDLVKYYLKAGLNDKAWGYLNQLLMTKEAPAEKIRFAQAKMLKTEKKWASAIEFFMLGYLAKSEWNHILQEEMFVKDIKTSANKLGWDEVVISKLTAMINTQLKSKKPSEEALIKEYRKLYTELTGNTQL